MDSGQESRGWSPLAKTLGLIGAGVLIGWLVVLVMAGGLAYTATLEFCATTCHEMSYVDRPYRASAHYAGRSGVRAVCVDCHIPPGAIEGFALKAWRTAVDITMHFVAPMDTPAKFEARRYAMASREWTRMKANGSAECRACHQAMNLARQTATAQAVHGSMAKDGNCVDCHAGIAHGRPEPPRPSAGAK